MHPKNFKDTIAASPYIFTIGVAGDSGSGKTTFTNGVRNIFGDDLVSTITLDDYHSLDRAGRLAAGVTPLDPRANRIALLEQDLIQFKRGVPVMKPCYNHATGTFDPPAIFRPKKILILEGLHTLFTDTLRRYLDFTLFVDPDREVKYDWKIRRDMSRRRYTRTQVLREIAEREPEYERYIAPQREFADAVIRIGYSRYGRDAGAKRNVYRVTLVQKRMQRSLGNIDLSLDLYSILSLSQRNFALEFVTGEKSGEQMGTMIMDGELSKHVVRKLEQSIERQTRVSPISIFKNRQYFTAGDVAQLILCWRIIHHRIFMEVSR
jgi:phosphoribulokinase